jgi:hypothetical protein
MHAALNSNSSTVQTHIILNVYHISNRKTILNLLKLLNGSYKEENPHSKEIHKYLRIAMVYVTSSRISVLKCFPKERFHVLIYKFSLSLSLSLSFCLSQELEIFFLVSEKNLQSAGCLR